MPNTEGNGEGVNNTNPAGSGEEPKVVSKDLFDDTSSKLAAEKKAKKALEKELADLKKANMSKEELDKAKAEEKEARIKEMEKELATSKLGSKISANLSKIEFDMEGEAYKNIIEDLSYDNLGVLINSLVETAFEKGKVEVTDKVMDKNASLGINKGGKANLNPSEETAKRIAKIDNYKIPDNPYFKN